MASPNANPAQSAHAQKVLLVGEDSKGIIAKRLERSGSVVTRAMGRSDALERARYKAFDAAVLLTKGSLLNVTEIAFNLRDLYGAMEIIIIIDSRWKHSHRFLRQLYDHPIAATEIMTRRQLQRYLSMPS